MVGLFSARKQKASFENFYGDIATRLIGARESEISSRLETAMADIGKRYGVNRVVLRWLPTEDLLAAGQSMEVAVGWRKDGKPIPDFTPEDLPWSIERLISGAYLCIEDTDQIPSEIDRHSLQSKGIASICALPLRIDDDVIGAFTLAQERHFHFPENIRSELESLAQLIANAYWSANYRTRIRASEARYRAVVQDQSDFILRWTPDREMTWVNERMCEYVGKSADELVGKSDLLFMTEDEWREFDKELSRLTPESPTFEHNHQWTRDDGEVAWNEWTVRGIFDEAGKLAEVQSVGRDITQRKRAAQALARQSAFQARLADVSSRLLSVATENMEQAIADILPRIGTDYGFDRANVTWYDDALPVFGLPISWVRGGTPVQAPKPDEFPAAYQVLSQRKVFRIDDVSKMSSAEQIDQARFQEFGLSSVLSLPLLIEGRIFGSATFGFREQRNWEESTIKELHLIADAITSAAVRQWSLEQLSRREKALERSQRVAKVGSYRLRATLSLDENSPEVLNILNITMSDQALEIFDIEPQPDPRAMVESLLARVHPDDEPRVRETWQATLRAGTEHTIEYRVIRPDGSTVHVQAKEQFDGIDSNGVITFFGTCKDITEWVESNQNLQTALTEIEELKDRLQDENLMLRGEVRAAHGFDMIIGNSRELRGVLESAARVAPTDVTVLIYGETGTGKELVARSIHDLSDRKDKPMVAVNCAALSAELIESELFGHEKGAFTGAHARRKGRFEIADGGTLFLDEIGEMSGDLQAKLLRVIQEGEFERLGGSTTLKTDVRLIAATNRNLVKAMDSGNFRADLYYRINAFPIELPPLRERKEDIPMLAEHLVRKHAKNLGKPVESISARTLRYLQDGDWPGNIRELESAIVRALISSSGPVLDYVGSDDSGMETDGISADAISLLDAQRKHIVDVLRRTRWVIEGKNGAASALGLAPSSLRSKMKRLNIVRPS